MASSTLDAFPGLPVTLSPHSNVNQTMFGKDVAGVVASLNEALSEARSSPLCPIFASRYDQPGHVVPGSFLP
jgi:hypothetical protein